MHGAGLQVEAHAIDFVQVSPGDADEARIVGIIDRVNLAVLIDAGFAGRQAVFLHRLELGVCLVAAVVLALPFDHVGVMGGLAVDRPRRAVVVWWRHPRLVVDVGEDLETELRVLVEHMQAARRVLAMLADKVRILQQVLELRADFLAPVGAGIARKDGTAVRYELIELIGHGVTPGRIICPSFAHREAERQRHLAGLDWAREPLHYGTCSVRHRSMIGRAMCGWIRWFACVGSRFWANSAPCWWFISASNSRFRSGPASPSSRCRRCSTWRCASASARCNGSKPNVPPGCWVLISRNSRRCSTSRAAWKIHSPTCCSGRC